MYSFQCFLGCPTLWMSLGKPSVEYAWDAIPNIQNRSKHLSLPLHHCSVYTNISDGVLSYLIYLNLIYIASNHLKVCLKNRPHSSLLREANHPEHGGIIIY